MKKLLIAAIAASLVMAFTGCGSDDDSSSSKKDKSSKASVTHLKRLRNPKPKNQRLKNLQLRNQRRRSQRLKNHQQLNPQLTVQTLKRDLRTEYLQEQATQLK